MLGIMCHTAVVTNLGMLQTDRLMARKTTTLIRRFSLSDRLSTLVLGLANSKTLSAILFIFSLNENMFCKYSGWLCIIPFIKLRTIDDFFQRVDHPKSTDDYNNPREKGQNHAGDKIRNDLPFCRAVR